MKQNQNQINSNKNAKSLSSNFKFKPKYNNYKKPKSDAEKYKDLISCPLCKCEGEVKEVWDDYENGKKNLEMYCHHCNCQFVKFMNIKKKRIEEDL